MTAEQRHLSSFPPALGRGSAEGLPCRQRTEAIANVKSPTTQSDVASLRLQ